LFLVSTNVFPLFKLPNLWVIRDQYRRNINGFYALTSVLMLQLNVCSLGWVIESTWTTEKEDPSLSE
jgi:hypothetical protein